MRERFYIYDSSARFSKRMMPNSFETMEGSEYVVKRGDTLYKIAKENNITIEDLMNANELTTTAIYPNQVLVIPRYISTGGMFFEEYQIRPNDTLETISNQTKIHMNDIQKYNDITKLVLQEGQIIRIPRGITQYIVKPTDTIESILEMSGLDPMELIRVNASRWLKPGMKIFI